MRRRLALLVAATTLVVLAAFLVPLALLVRTVAADRAVNAATREAESLVPLVATVDRRALDLTLQRLAHDDGADFPLTVFFPDGARLGAPAPVSPAVELARSGHSVTAVRGGGREIVVAVQGAPGGTTVVRAFVPEDQLRQGVARTWLILGLLGVSLLALSLLVAARLARSVVRPVGELAAVAHRLAAGDLDARALADGGPPEVREVGAGLNLLADRIGELLAAEREDVADLSHQLRTPLTALRLSVDGVRDEEERARLGDAVDGLERTVDRVIREARRPIREGVAAGCDAAATVRERVGFWSALAEEEERAVTADIADRPTPVRVTADDLEAAVDALLGNVFAHTPAGTAFAVRLAPRRAGGAVLVVGDDGPGLPDGREPAGRGASGDGSTGLGLDIVRRTAMSSGGAVRFGRTPSGGAEVTVELGAPAAFPTRPT
ncbi:MAG: sensor histidine kinase [Streptosporangiaceae bacterium]